MLASSIIFWKFSKYFKALLLKMENICIDVKILDGNSCVNFILLLTVILDAITIFVW